jgi:hypothetical protein
MQKSIYKEGGKAEQARKIVIIAKECKVKLWKVLEMQERQ